MKSSKERKMDRKRKHKELGAAKTNKSRQRRLDNKAKRDEIHAINPDAKVKIINQKTYINDAEVAIVNGKINNVLELAVPEAFRHKAVIEKIETKNKNALQRLTDKFRSK